MVKSEMSQQNHVDEGHEEEGDEHKDFGKRHSLMLRPIKEIVCLR